MTSYIKITVNTCEFKQTSDSFNQVLIRKLFEFIVEESYVLQYSLLTKHIIVKIPKLLNLVKEEGFSITKYIILNVYSTLKYVIKGKINILMSVTFCFYSIRLKFMVTSYT